MGTGGFMTVVKWLGHEVDDSPPSSAKVKTVWSYASTAPYVFMAWCSVKQKRYIYGMVLDYA
jgi:hypothetical protein